MSENGNKMKLRLFEVVISLLLTLCLGLSAWCLKTTVQHGEVLAGITSNRFTSSDGLAVWKAINEAQVAIAKIPAENPPKWFVDRVAALENRIINLNLEAKMAQIQSTLDQNAKTLDTFSRLLDAHMKESQRP
jgi:hypothetical protein